MARYNFYKHDNEIICVSRYAGKPVKAVAKCAPQDEFNDKIGSMIAKMRVDIKVAEKRQKRLQEEKERIWNMIGELEYTYNTLAEKETEVYFQINALKNSLASIVENPS